MMSFRSTNPDLPPRAVLCPATFDVILFLPGAGPLPFASLTCPHCQNIHLSAALPISQVSSFTLAWRAPQQGEPFNAKEIRSTSLDAGPV